jgi:hypothetical protein
VTLIQHKPAKQEEEKDQQIVCVKVKINKKFFVDFCNL